MTAPTEADNAKAREVVATVREHLSGDEFVYPPTWREVETNVAAALAAARGEGRREGMRAALAEFNVVELVDTGRRSGRNLPVLEANRDGKPAHKIEAAIRALLAKEPTI
jgi:hypothetical protein